MAMQCFGGQRKCATEGAMDKYLERAPRTVTMAARCVCRVSALALHDEVTTSWSVTRASTVFEALTRTGSESTGHLSGCAAA